MSAEQQKIWETYAAAWKAETADEKRALFEQSLAANCQYTDPTIQTNGYEELLAYMLGFHQQVPGGHFVTTSFACHHQQSLTQWNMLAGNGEKVGEGCSYGRYNDEGELVAMTGFFDVDE